MTHRYFGPPSARKTHEVQSATPVGSKCPLCDETIGQGDSGTITPQGYPFHHECTMRGIIGSVGHQLSRCSCYGGNEEDPPGMTRRQAAIAATLLFDSTRLGLPTYRTDVVDGYPAIVCLVCGKASYNATDIKEKFCGRCNLFHATASPMKRS